MNVKEGVHIFSVYFWHSEGWTPRIEALLEAVLKQANTTRHPWREDFEKSLWFQREMMHVVAPKGASTCRSKGPKDVWFERTYDCVVASGSLKGKILQMEVVEDFESRPHKAVSFVVRRKKEIKEWKEQKLPKVLPGYSGWTLPGRNIKEKGRRARRGQ